MPKKIYVKPPPPTRTAMVIQIVMSGLFLVFGIGLFIGVMDELGEAMPFVAFFFLIWTVACLSLVVYGLKMLKLIKSGKFEIAEIGGTDSQPENTFAERLRDLEGLKKDGLISEDEYRQKRADIVQEKW